LVELETEMTSSIQDAVRSQQSEKAADEEEETASVYTYEQLQER